MGNLIGGGAPRIAAPIIPSDTGAEAGRQETLERRIMRARAGAAANVLTSPQGISGRGANTQLGAAS